MSENHTPTPWVYVHESTSYGAGGDDVTFGYLMQEGDEQYHIASMIVDTLDGRANADFIVTAVNSYASSQAEIERLRDTLQPIKTHGYLANIQVDQGWGSSGKKPASKDVWCFPRHMLEDLDAALSGSKEQ